MKTVKIIYSGGPGYKARIVDAETGELITGFQVIDIHIDCNSIPVATMQVYAPYLDIEVPLQIAAPVTVTEVTE